MILNTGIFNILALKVLPTHPRQNISGDVVMNGITHPTVDRHFCIVGVPYAGPAMWKNPAVRKNTAGHGSVVENFHMMSDHVVDPGIGGGDELIPINFHVTGYACETSIMIGISILRNTLRSVCRHASPAESIGHCVSWVSTLNKVVMH